ncbi:hypothetical protein FF36_02025 [Frankia torreyi]|uniref:Uncharacterized protein n=1 Tax=Frankia torreyi TaxID=1856 RepID=A0A0D8BHF9_9ACTN|nr:MULTISPECIES: hypothetical protein [Frankia]KJE23576.1 hypothetical protein FF36_02025 [Frankia torreyi]KQM05881.1 hypothetical protein FF86_101249 [Frankia sp. CpI1-P]
MAAGGGTRGDAGDGGTPPPAAGPRPPGDDDREAIVAAELRAWRARAAATADPAWSLAGSGPVSLAAPQVGAAAGGAAPDGWSSPTASRAHPWDLPSAPAVSTSASASARTAASAERSWSHRFASHCAWLPGPLAVCAGVAVIIASGMRWATVRAYGFVEFTVRGTDPDQHGRLTVLLGILAVVAGLLLAAGRREWGRLLATMAGLMILLAAAVDLVQLYRGGPFVNSGLRTAITVGPGLWVIACCGFVVLLVGLAARFAHRPAAGGDEPRR